MMDTQFTTVLTTQIQQPPQQMEMVTFLEDGRSFFSQPASDC